MAKKTKTVKSQSDIHNVDPPDDDDDIETNEELNEDERDRDEKVKDYQEAAQKKAEDAANNPPAPPRTREQVTGEPVPPPAGSPTPAETTVTIRADGTVESGTAPPPATEK
jgi:hypothetical protein